MIIAEVQVAPSTKQCDVKMANLKKLIHWTQHLCQYLEELQENEFLRNTPGLDGKITDL